MYHKHILLSAFNKQHSLIKTVFKNNNIIHLIVVYDIAYKLKNVTTNIAFMGVLRINRIINEILSIRKL